MTTATKQNRTAARPKNKGLTVTIRLRPDLVPLFKIGMTLMRAKDVERFLEWLIIKGLTSEALMDRFDEQVNKLL